MGPFAELLAVGHREALEFFVTALRDVSGRSVDRRELLYNASVLAHYAQTSTDAVHGWPAPPALSHVFDHFVVPPLPDDAEVLETAAAECLLLAGFFEDQMSRRHNINWYSRVGASFFMRASLRQESAVKAQLLETLARQFEPWRRRHARLGRQLRDQQYLLRRSARSS